MIRRVARAVAKKGAEVLIEEATGREIPDVADAIRRIEAAISRRSGLRPDDAVEIAVDNGEIPERDLEEAERVIMVDFQAFMSIALNQCGNDQRTFRQLTQLWNRDKAEIKAMTQAELRRNLRCP